MLETGRGEDENRIRTGEDIHELKGVGQVCWAGRGRCEDGE